MKKNKIGLLLLLFCANIIVIIILCFSIKINNDNKKYELEKQNINTSKIEELQELKSNDTYYTLIECINNYAVNATDKNKFIDQWYLNCVDINKKELDSDLFERYTTYEPQTIKFLKKDNVSIYYIYGEIIRADGEIEPREYNLIVKLDYKNYKYSIIPEIIENIEKYEEAFNELNSENYETFKIKNSSNLLVTSRYLRKYLLEAKNNLTESFKLIDDDYKEKRFSNNVNEYIKYINENYDLKNNIPTVEKFNKYKTSKYNIYLVQDNQQHMYILKEKAVNNFTVMLDIDTIKVDDIKNEEING